MNSILERPYRKNLTSRGLIYMGGSEQEITVKNLSITGVLAEFHNESYGGDIKDIFNTLVVSTRHDLYLPELRLAGEVEVVRVDMDGDYILLALEFKYVTYDIDDLFYKRKAYRKSMSDIGHILLSGKYREFTSVNVSVDGLMIRLSEKISVEEGTVTAFEFERLELEGEVRVIWMDFTEDNGTLMGLKYISLNKSEIKGIPRFSYQ
ncbi:MAG: PilZ domain-containing protein [Methylococcaceae bacterium]